MLFYILAALIRLAYFNVMEEERQKTESGARKEFVGVPVTSAALVFPTILLFQFLLPGDLTILYFVFMLLLSILFLAKIRVPKPGMKGIWVMVFLGLLEFAIFIVGWNILR